MTRPHPGSRRAQPDELPAPLRFEPLRRLLAIGRRSAPLWLYPGLSLLLGMLLGLLLSTFVTTDGGPLGVLVYEGDASSARSFVSLAATSVATITSLTLTITVVTLQLASSQYSPRLIEHYLDDRGIRSVISLFLLTFAFAVATLLNVRLPEESSSSGEVPGVAISALIVLIVACLGALVFFVYRVTQSIRVEAILERVRDRTIAAIGRHEQDDGGGEDIDEVPEPDENAALVFSRRTGYFVELDHDAIDESDIGREARVWLLVAPGEFVVKGSPVAAHVRVSADDPEATIESWLQFDDERWIESDYEFGVRSLTDVAVKALSPGINDPTTAVMAIHRIAEVLAEAANHHADRIRTTRDGGHVFVAVRSWIRMLQMVLHQLALYGRDDLDVVIAVTRMLVWLRWVEAASDIDRAEDIRRLADEFAERVETERAAPDRAALEQALDDMRRSLDGEVRHEFRRRAALAHRSEGRTGGDR